jgi:serine/threonine protein kinase
MQFGHSRNSIHRDLNPENILVDWDNTARIADSGDSASPAAENIPPLMTTDASRGGAEIDFRDRAPECFDSSFDRAGDVFAFRMILFEIMAGRIPFSESLSRLQIQQKTFEGNERPEILDSVLPSAETRLLGNASGAPSTV